MFQQDSTPPTYDSIESIASNRDELSRNVLIPVKYRPSIEKDSNKNKFKEAIQRIRELFSKKRFLALWVICITMYITMIVYGVIYKDRCKINPQLPLVFIAIGAIGNFTTFVHALTHNIPQIRNYRQTYPVASRVVKLFQILFQIALFGLIIYATVWTFNLSDMLYRDREQIQAASNCTRCICNQTFYKYAYSILICFWSIIGVIVFILVFFVFYSLIIPCYLN